jgi:hypothetical protein
VVASACGVGAVVVSVGSELAVSLGSVVGASLSAVVASSVGSFDGVFFFLVSDSSVEPLSRTC